MLVAGPKVSGVCEDDHPATQQSQKEIIDHTSYTINFETLKEIDPGCPSGRSNKESRNNNNGKGQLHRVGEGVSKNVHRPS